MAVALVIIAALIFVARLTYWATRIRQDAKDAAAAEARQQGTSAKSAGAPGRTRKENAG